MSIDFESLGQRLRAYRIGASLRAEQIAEQLGVSRAAVYRMEKGEIVKIETLERLAQMLNTSLASLLGVEVEYYATALGYFERMRQLEERSVRIMAHFEPVSYLLTSPDYHGHLATMLEEATPDDAKTDAWRQTQQQLLAILEERKTHYRRTQPTVISLIGVHEIEQFLHLGLIGKIDLPPSTRMARSLAARREIEHLTALIERAPMGIQIGIVDDSMPTMTFQVFQQPERSYVAVSPYRLGELPNVRTGIATVTASPEAVWQYQRMIDALWDNAYKGLDAARLLRGMLSRF